MSIESSLKQLVESVEKRDLKQYEFLKQILLIAITLLGVLVSFHTQTSNNIYSQKVYLITITTLTIGIICSAIGLYEQVATSKIAYEKLKKAIQKQIETNAAHFDPIVANPPKIYIIFCKIGYISLIISTLSLGIYAILLDIKI
ncbi:hypothetical protein PBAC_33370 [Pedobacter glucosidilyticus]|nr:hypothetical protein [Pedobacter glucosidilyticus]KHJ36503.1 hypothetical protein PBAC_33370 [Pedobacter glucosidilyticus]